MCRFERNTGEINIIWIKDHSRDGDGWVDEAEAVAKRKWVWKQILGKYRLTIRVTFWQDFTWQTCSTKTLFQDEKVCWLLLVLLCWLGVLKVKLHPWYSFNHLTVRSEKTSNDETLLDELKQRVILTALNQFRLYAVPCHPLPCSPSRKQPTVL